MIYRMGEMGLKTAFRAAQKIDSLAAQSHGPDLILHHFESSPSPRGSPRLSLQKLAWKRCSVRYSFAKPDVWCADGRLPAHTPFLQIARTSTGDTALM